LGAIGTVALVVLTVACGGSSGNAPGSSPQLTRIVPVVQPADTADGATAGGGTNSLPLGDGKLSNAPQAGYVWRCGQGGGGGGAFRDGPWIDTTSRTFDPAQKVTVDGAVKWQNMLTITLENNIRRLKTNDLPNHTTGVFPIASTDDAFLYDRNPNSIRAQNVDLSLPANPVVAENASCLQGPVGVTLTGVELFDGLDAPGRDAVAHEIQDSCGGHPEVTGAYHYHAQPLCFDVAPFADGHSGLIGYAMDGFGIYGPNGEHGVALSDADLDECHGHTHEIVWDGQVVTMYHYHFTTEFPYSISCFKGTPIRQRR